MKKLSKKLTKTFFNLLWQYKPCDYASRIIYYHSVHPNHPLAHKPDMFRKQLQWLFDNGYTCPVLSEFETYYQQDKVVFITFDDGYLDNWEYAFPILNEFNFKATFFVCSGYINQEENQDSSGGHQLSKGLKMLNAKNLLQMKNAGMEIGSHGVSHRMMSRLDHLEQYQELFASKETLEKFTSGDIVSYAYPNGQRGAITEYANVESVNMGYKIVCSTLWGSCTKQSNLLNRCEMSHEDSMHDFVAKITGKRDYRKYIDLLVDKSKAWSREK